MKPNEYLNKVLKSQELKKDGAEMKALDEREAAVRAIIKKAFPEEAPEVRRAGSLATDTAVLASYDLDLPCFFHHESTAAGNSLKEIYEHMEEVLGQHYPTERKTSAIRLITSDFHVDVVPGRFVKKDAGDVYLHRTDDPDKEKQMTNVGTHIQHVLKSGRARVLKLLKVWKHRSGQHELRTFVLNHLAIKALAGHEKDDLASQVKTFWTYVVDHQNSLAVEDPANTNNDLSAVLSAATPTLVAEAQLALDTITDEDHKGWEAIFGTVPDDEQRIADLRAVAAAAPAAHWSNDDEC